MTEQELKDEIKRYKAMLTEKGIDLAAQTWIELQLMELRKELRAIRKQKNNPPHPH